jgi:hypothetical protein
MSGVIVKKFEGSLPGIPPPKKKRFVSTSPETTGKYLLINHV